MMKTHVARVLYHICPFCEYFLDIKHYHSHSESVVFHNQMKDWSHSHCLSYSHCEIYTYYPFVLCAIMLLRDTNANNRWDELVPIGYIKALIRIYCRSSRIYTICLRAHTFPYRKRLPTVFACIEILMLAQS